MRSIYRMIEFAGGRDGYVRTHEWPFWVFDSFLIWCMSPFPFFASFIHVKTTDH